MKTQTRIHLLFVCCFTLASILLVFNKNQFVSAEDSSTAIIKKSPEQTIKLVDRPSKIISNPKYIIEIHPIEIKPMPVDRNQKGSRISNPQIDPFKKIDAPKGGIISDTRIGPFKRMETERGIITSGPQVGPFKKIDAGKGVRTSDPQIGPFKRIETESSGDKQSLPSERVKVTGGRAYKLDKSGQKTNEEIPRGIRVIESTDQPPTEFSK